MVDYYFFLIEPYYDRLGDLVFSFGYHKTMLGDLIFALGKHQTMKVDVVCSLG